mgnify:CR=1 FL=1
MIVGSPPKLYNLPIALLCVHSIYFRNEIVRLNATRTENMANKKRKLSSDSESVLQEDTSDEEMSIKLPDVDPTIFGLFLKFIYQGRYPPNVDAKFV